MKYEDATIGRTVRVCSKEGKCRLITAIVARDKENQTVTVDGFRYKGQVISLDQIKPL